MILPIVPDPDLSAWWSEGRPRDVEPARAREQLVGIFPRLEEVHEALELSGVKRPDVCSLANEMLRISHTAHLAVNGLATEAGVDNDWSDHMTGWLQQHEAAKGQVRHGLHRRDILRVLLEVEELTQEKVRR